MARRFDGSQLADLCQEMFVQTLVDQAHTVVKSERKPRKNIQYRDLASGVARNDSLEFLSDVIPPTVPYKVVKAKHARAGAARPIKAGENGSGGTDEKKQTTLVMSARNNTTGHDNEQVEEVDPSSQLLVESRTRQDDAEPTGTDATMATNDGDVEMG
jgi:hypothetical protein